MRATIIRSPADAVRASSVRHGADTAIDDVLLR
jgi:hypothetical protein